MRDDLAERIAPYQAREVPELDLAWPPDAAPFGGSSSLKARLSWYRVTRLPRHLTHDHHPPLGH